MNSITSFIKRYPQGVFWTIAYIISGGGYALSLMYPSPISGPLSFGESHWQAGSLHGSLTAEPG